MGSEEFRCIRLLSFLVLLGLGCDQPVEVRIYDGPKTDTVFVSGPNASLGNATTAGGPVSGPRRILGAVIPTESGCYFLKATDTPERLQPLLSDFSNIVAEFTIDPSTGKPSMRLPEGWVMNPRNDIAMAEFVSPTSTGGAKFTVTMLAMPPAEQWQDYLLSNINRWRGQLKLPDITGDAINDELMSVTRPSSPLPGYIFDAVGNGSGGMNGSSAASTTASPPLAPPNPAASSKAPMPRTPSGPDAKPSGTADSDANESKKPQLKYRLPEGWQPAPGTPFRLATFSVSTSEGEGEVTVSMAVDNPMGNTMMWYQQISRESDPEKIKALADSTVAKSEKIASPMGDGLLYSIRDSEQPDAPMLLVASLPSDREGLHVFVKLRGEAKVVDSQRASLLTFIQSLQLQ